MSHSDKNTNKKIIHKPKPTYKDLYKDITTEIRDTLKNTFNRPNSSNEIQVIYPVKAPNKDR